MCVCVCVLCVGVGVGVGVYIRTHTHIQVYHDVLARYTDTMRRALASQLRAEYRTYAAAGTDSEKCALQCLYLVNVLRH